MKLRKDTMRLSTLALAVAGTLISLSARADEDEDVAALKKPTNSMGIGAIAVSDGSAKFGEYSGLNKDHAYLNLNLDLRGGSAYADNERGGTTRWSLTGSNLGLHSRSFGVSFSNQGAWSFGVGYDGLRHNLSDTYQTPYAGKMGGNTFVLPAGFGTAANTTTLSAAQQATYRKVDVSSTRENTFFNAALNISPHLAMNFDFNHLDQSGAKLMAFGSAAKVGGVTGQAVSVLPNPTKSQTDTFTLALNWMGDKGHLTSSYFGSFFHDSYNSVNFQTFAGGNVMQTMSTAPSNELHQLNLDGNYAFSAKTKLIGNLSYSRNTQNDPFMVDAGMLNAALPKSSLDGLVVTKNVNLKLVNQSIKDFTISAGYKYNDRDNRTPSNIYSFNAIDTTNVAAYPNTPLSVKKSQYEVAGDYRIKKSQNIRLAYTHDDLSRECNQYASSATYPAGTNCVVATNSEEDKIEATYRLKPVDSLDLKFGYGYGERSTISDRYAKAAFSGNTNGLGAGVNGGDYFGYYPFFDASRKQRLAKTSANWQVNEQLSFGLGGKYSDDRYDDSSYGVQNGNSWSLNLDTTYAYSEKGSVSLYATQQNRQRKLTSLNGLPANSWANTLKDEDLTLGLGLKHAGLAGGRLEVAGDFNYVVGKTSSNTLVPYLATCDTSATLTCGPIPDIKSRSVQFKLSGNYKVDKSSTIQLQYVYARMSSTDYYYNAYQYGLTPNGVLATNQQPDNYSIHAIAATYIHNF